MIKTKLDVAEAHLLAAMQMIGCRINPYSVHLEVMAADELIETIADVRGVELSYGSRVWVKDEFRKEWFAAKKKAYNYFRHADRDPDVEYDGPSHDLLQTLNDGMLAMSTIGLRELGRKLPAPLLIAPMVVGALYPKWYKWDEVVAIAPQMKEGVEKYVGKMDRRMYESVVQNLSKKTGCSTSTSKGGLSESKP